MQLHLHNLKIVLLAKIYTKFLSSACQIRQLFLYFCQYFNSYNGDLYLIHEWAELCWWLLMKCKAIVLFIIQGIKRRLGTVGNESTILDARQKLKQKRRGTPETITQSIARVLKEVNSDCADDNSEKILPIRKRGWRRSTKVWY